MSDLTPVPGWDAVKRLETDTKALGGPGAPMNEQAQALLNRTEALNPDNQTAPATLNGTESWSWKKAGAWAKATSAALAAYAIQTYAGFKQTGALSVSRTPQAKMGEAVSALDWGAATTGTVSSAVSAVKTAGGGTLKFPNGNYSAITLPADYAGVVLDYDGPNVPVTLFGESAGTTFIARKVLRSQNNTTHAGTGQSVMHIENVASGTGTSGPMNADYGFSVSMLKKNFSVGTAVSGELDGGYVAVRNDGADSDTAGLLIDVGNYGVGFNAIFEGNCYGFSGNTIAQGINNQAGVIDTRTGRQYGYVVQKNYGIGGVAYLATSGSGQFQNLLQYWGNGQTKFDMPIDANNVVRVRLFDASNVGKTIRVNAGKLSIMNNAETAEIATISDAGDLAISGALTAGKAGMAAYTPTLSAASGSFTSASATGHYVVLGDMCHVTISISITTLGTGTFPIVGLPFSRSASADCVNLVGRESATSGKMCIGTLFDASRVQIYGADNSNVAANGASIKISGSYPIA